MSYNSINAANAAIAAAAITAFANAVNAVATPRQFNSASGKGWRITEGRDSRGWYTRATREGFFKDTTTVYYHPTEERMHRVFAQYIITHR